MLFSDDDFPIIYSIERLITFLENNNNYTIAGGYLINFDLFKKNNTNLKKEETYGVPIHFFKFFVKILIVISKYFSQKNLRYFVIT